MGFIMNIAYVNGEYVPIEDAKVSVRDRGLMFSDGVYEVAAIINGKLIDNFEHLKRLERSLSAIKLLSPVPVSEIPDLEKELLTKNNIKEGTLYLHVTRGESDREFAFPDIVKPSLVMFVQSKNLIHLKPEDLSAIVITVPDIRWKRRDIKSIALIAQVMAKQIAKEEGADEVWMVEDGCITEGGSSNAFIIKGDKLITRNTDNMILSGITRKAIMTLAEDFGISIEERAFTVDEAYNATEAFFTSASAFIMPVVRIDGKLISGGKPGPISLKLRELYINFAIETAI
jgi:D-alanine transaminase